MSDDFTTGTPPSGRSPRTGSWALGLLTTALATVVVSIVIARYPPGRTNGGLSFEQTTLVNRIADGVASPVVSRFEFKFTNRGPAAVEIEKAFTSCSCTVVDAKNRRIAAGESGVIPVTMNVTGSGEQTQNVGLKLKGRPDVVTLKLTIVYTPPREAFANSQHVRLTGRTATTLITLKGNVRPLPTVRRMTAAKGLVGIEVVKTEAPPLAVVGGQFVSWTTLRLTRLGPTVGADVVSLGFSDTAWPDVRLNVDVIDPTAP